MSTLGVIRACAYGFPAAHAESYQWPTSILGSILIHFRGPYLEEGDLIWNLWDLEHQFMNL